MSTQDEQMTRAAEVQAKYTDELMRKAHVQGTAIGLAKVGGKYTDQIALVVLVDKKVPVSQLDPKDVIPKELEGIRVDVQEVGFLQAQ
jgi:hypothetical protein